MSSGTYKDLHPNTEKRNYIIKHEGNLMPTPLHKHNALLRLHPNTSIMLFFATNNKVRVTWSIR